MCIFPNNFYGCDFFTSNQKIFFKIYFLVFYYTIAILIKNKQHQDEAEINSFLAMCDTIWLPVIVWEKFCFEQKLSRFFQN